MTDTYRAPTFQEAVEFIMDRHHSLDYRRRCIAFWRLHYGDVLADKVQARVRELWNKR